MSNQDRILQMIQQIEEYLFAIRKLQPVTQEKLISDLFFRSALERLLYLACDSLISVLEMFIAFKKYRSATSYSDNIYVLQEKNEISEKQAQQLFQIIGFRNILSHDYTKMNLEIVADIANQGIDEIEEILKEFKQKI